MTKGRRRGRPAPFRWGGSIALAGIALAVAGGYLQFGDRAGAAAPEPAITTTAPPLPRRVLPVKAPVIPSQKPVAHPGKPLRLVIPRLGVSAAVLGIASEEGALTPPSNPRTVGWWSAGAQPGASLGSAVITGHTVHTGGGAFDDLEQLQTGDTITVTTDHGRLGYRVTTVTTYRKQALAKNAAHIFDQTVPGRLVLITCEDWNGTVYLSNAVAIAERTN
ncbi:class F sortase [Kribbella sp. NPDC020789]